MKKKSIIIKEFHHKELVKISKTFGSNYSELIESMILYFKKTGINPVEAINENPAAMVKALDKRIVSFIKTQERDILNPMRKEIFQYSTQQKKQYDNIKSVVTPFFEWSKGVVAKTNEFDKNRTQLINKELKKIQVDFAKQQKAIIVIAQLIDHKNKSGIQNKIIKIFKNANK